MKYTKELLEEAVGCSASLCEVLRFLRIELSGGAHRHIRSRIKHFNIDVSHFVLPLKRINAEKLSWERVLVKNRLGTREHTHILRRALTESGVEETCEKCGLGKEWCSEPIQLQIDHKNGDGLDNQKNNLRFLCPNCHSQTTNFGSKRLKKDRPKSCHKTRGNKHPRSNCKRPAKDILEKLVFEKPSTAIGREFGVSGKAVEKWCKHYGIEKPGRGYWTKRLAV